MFSLHAKHSTGEYTLIAGGLLPDKLKYTYSDFFGLFRARMFEATGKSDCGKIKHVMADWESGITYGVDQNFPRTVKRLFCSFHYAQAIIRNVGKLGGLTVDKYHQL